MTDWQERVVVVTGAAGNLGQAVAAAFRQRQARLVLVDRGKDRLAQVYPNADPSQVLLVPGIDLADPSAADRFVDAATRQFGRIDALVNTVGGYAGGKPVHDDDLAIWDRMFTLNLRTVLNACRAVIPQFIQQRRGRIVNIGARAALSGVATLAAYCASKSAVIRLTESLAGELKEHGIAVNCVLPGTIDTPQNRADMPAADHSRWVPPEDLANAIVFLVSDEARAISGAALPVYGRS